MLSMNYLLKVFIFILFKKSSWKYFLIYFEKLKVKVKLKRGKFNTVYAIQSISY